MLARPLAAFVSFAVAVVAPQGARNIAIGDWSLTIPSDAIASCSLGPDFKVTHISFPKKHGSIGIYQGNFPQHFSQGKEKVVKKADLIGGESVIWSIWGENVRGTAFWQAETHLNISVRKPIPGPFAGYQLLHVFLLAPKESDLNALQEIVRTLRKKRENEKLESIPETMDSGEQLD